MLISKKLIENGKVCNKIDSGLEHLYKIMKTRVDVCCFVAKWISVSSDLSWSHSLRYLMRMFSLTLHCFPCVCFGKDLESNCFTDWGISMMIYANQCYPTGTSSSRFWTSILGYVLENDLMVCPLSLLRSTIGVESISKWLREGASASASSRVASEAAMELSWGLCLYFARIRHFFDIEKFVTGSSHILDGKAIWKCISHVLNLWPVFCRSKWLTVG